MAIAHAASADISGFRGSTDCCRILLEHRRDDDPPSLYCSTSEQVSAEAGHAFVEPAAINPAHTGRLLAEATTLLPPHRPRPHQRVPPRSALLHGVHLAHSHLLAHDPGATAATLLQLADRVPEVQCVRCRNLLRRIRRSAGTRMRASDGARALTAVDRALWAP
ncbi:hypothetical protein [Streptomyces sp. LaBMicrA B280]|uniref:hypothetical protein n=1 Tax=Streptomyces sp. LaBMicrA B280 TaxID=3391001 RepID=UPI003BA495CE